MPIHTLNIDLETRSGADISKTGVYRYAEDKDFDILLFGVSVNKDPVEVYDLARGETIPGEILRALTDDSVIKHAYNASFERVCLSMRTTQAVRIPGSETAISIRRTRSTLRITLPSQRTLTYIHPEISTGQYGTESVTYMGQDAQRKWTRIESYGPKFVENIIQAVSRDLLAEAMKRLTKAGYKIVGHVHDEVIIEAPETATVQEVCAEMQKTPGWLPGIDLRADGYECGYYMKA